MSKSQLEARPGDQLSENATYPAYRDVDLKGIRNVPASWDVKRADWFLTEQRRTVDPSTLDADQVYHYSIPTLQETGTGALEPPEEIGSIKLLIDGPTLLVSRLNPHKGVVTLADHQGVPTLASSEFVALRASACSLKFAYYMYSSESTRQRLVAQVQSATRSHMRARPADITKMWHPMPPRATQSSIADFLDVKTQSLDDLIAKKERLIELLEEKRTALITQAVTKGLDPDVPMKDSGVEWLGEIPEHWETPELRYLCDTGRPIMYGIILPGPSVEEGVPIVKSGDVKGRTVSESDLSKTTVEIDRDNKKSRVEAGDVVYSIRGSFGDVARIPPELAGANLTQDVARISPRKQVDGVWLEYVLRSSPVNAQVDASALGAAVRGINIRELKRIRVPLSPQDEQEAIARQLDCQEKKIQHTINTVDIATERLREYRSSLITAAVTGQIDVRDHAA